MVAYDLEIRDWKTLVSVYEATLLGCLHAVALDAIVDSNSEVDGGPPIRDVYLLHLLFTWQLESLGQIAPQKWSSEGFSFFLATQLEICGALYEEELMHFNCATPYGDGHILEAKCAALKIVIHEVVQTAGRPDLTEAASTLVDRASFAMCLLDDAWDWEQDLVMKRYTFPIQQALERLEIDDPSAEEAESLLTRVRRALFVDGVILDILDEVIRGLRQCQRDIASLSPKAELWFWLAEQSARGYSTAIIQQLSDLDRRHASRS